MASKTVNTGSAGSLVMTAVESSTSAAGNYSNVTWSLYLKERTSYPYSYANGIGAYVNLGGTAGVDWSGTFDFDWSGGGLSNTLIASGTTRVNHNADGSMAIAVDFGISDTGTSGAGGPTSSSMVLTLTTLKVIPGVPTGVAAARVSDTQTKVTWAQASASNGAPTTNTIQESVNGGAFVDLVTINATTTATISTAANRKTTYRVRGNNTAGSSGYSAASAPIYTTPAAPSAVAATKNSGLDVVVSFTDNVAYAEHEHEVWHGVVAGGVTTWDGAALATLPNGTTSYTHVAPNSAQVHIYRVRAKAGALLSGFVSSNSVQLLVAPNKPTFQAIPSRADKALALTFGWVHNPIDTTPQKYYEVGYSTDGGTTWTSSGKVASAVSARTIAANAYAANTTVTLRVRTWGSATTGGSDGTGASPWSNLAAVTFKTVPTVTITAPANGSVLNQADLRVNLGFAQAEGATFVSATLSLVQDGVTLEVLETSTALGTQMATQVENGGTYTVGARVKDSNGLLSEWATSTFTVVYLAPVTPVVALSYLPETGYGQVDVTLPDPAEGESAAATVTVTRSIDGVEEVLYRDHPAAPELTFLDTTATIHGTNTYTVTTTSELGAQESVVQSLVTSECRRAFLSKGNGFSIVGAFGANLSVSETLSVASDTIGAAGRTKPIGLYGVETSVQLKVQSFVMEDFGSTVDELRAVLLVPGKACYRDASGRRVFGSAKGSVAYKKVTRGDLSFTITETS